MIVKDGDSMPTKLTSKSIEVLITEADELIKKINSEFLDNLEEEHRLQFEKHAQALHEIKSAFHTQTGKSEPSEESSFAGGMHQAVLDIVKAMKDLVGYFG